MSGRAERLTCYYCGERVLAARIEMDHFPKPASCGGTTTVPACILCHDLKDRTNWEDLPIEMKAEFLADLEKASRSTKIVLAMFMRMAFEANNLATDAKQLPVS